MTGEPLQTPKMVIHGEGSVSPAFIGSVYMRDNGETVESTDRRFSKAMNLMGLEWLGAGE